MECMAAFSGLGVYFHAFKAPISPVKIGLVKSNSGHSMDL